MQLDRYIHRSHTNQAQICDICLPVVVRTNSGEIIQLDTATCQNNLLQIEASLPKDYELDSIQVFVRKKS